MKTISIIALTLTLATSPALAKTEGNYVGIDILQSSVKHKYFDESDKDKSTGFGLNYKYAFNFDKIFLAPGVFTEKLGLKTRNKIDQNATISTNYRHGVKLDLGYDITDNFSAYFTNGFASFDYKLDDNDGYSESKSIISYFYGAGLSYKILKNMAMNLEYNTQSPNFTNTYDVKLKSNAQIAKIGISYNF